MYQVKVIAVFTVFRLLTDFVCLYDYYEFWISLWKIVRGSVILLLPLFSIITKFAVLYKGGILLTLLIYWSALPSNESGM